MQQRKVYIFRLSLLKASYSYALTVVQHLYRATGSSECAQTSSGGPTRRCTRRSSLQARTGRCSFSTNARFTFSGSPSSKLPFHMYLALVQTLYRATGSNEFAQISTDGPTRRCTRRSSLQARTGRCSFCTNTRFIFLGSPSSKLPFHMPLALVQTLYRATGSSECAKISTGALHCATRDAVVFRPVQEGAPFAPTQSLHF